MLYFLSFLYFIFFFTLSLPVFPSLCSCLSLSHSGLSIFIISFLSFSLFPVVIIFPLFFFIYIYFYFPLLHFIHSFSLASSSLSFSSFIFFLSLSISLALLFLFLSHILPSLPLPSLPSHAYLQLFPLAYHFLSPLPSPPPLSALTEGCQGESASHCPCVSYEFQGERKGKGPVITLPLALPRSPSLKMADLAPEGKGVMVGRRERDVVG